MGFIYKNTRLFSRALRVGAGRRVSPLRRSSSSSDAQWSLLGAAQHYTRFAFTVVGPEVYAQTFEINVLTHTI